MKIKFNKNLVLIENEKGVTTFDILFFKAFGFPIFTADPILLTQIESAIPDANGDITLVCQDNFINFLNTKNINYTISG